MSRIKINGKFFFTSKSLCLEVENGLVILSVLCDNNDFLPFARDVCLPYDINRRKWYDFLSNASGSESDDLPWDEKKLKHIRSKCPGIDESKVKIYYAICELIGADVFRIKNFEPEETMLIQPCKQYDSCDATLENGEYSIILSQKTSAYQFKYHPTKELADNEERITVRITVTPTHLNYEKYGTSIECYNEGSLKASCSILPGEHRYCKIAYDKNTDKENKIDGAIIEFLPKEFKGRNEIISIFETDVLSKLIDEVLNSDEFKKIGKDVRDVVSNKFVNIICDASKEAIKEWCNMKERRLSIRNLIDGFYFLHGGLKSGVVSSIYHDLSKICCLKSGVIPNIYRNLSNIIPNIELNKMNDIMYITESEFALIERTSKENCIRTESTTINDIIKNSNIGTEMKTHLTTIIANAVKKTIDENQSATLFQMLIPKESSNLSSKKEINDIIITNPNVTFDQKIINHYIDMLVEKLIRRAFHTTSESYWGRETRFVANERRHSSLSSLKTDSYYNQLHDYKQRKDSEKALLGVIDNEMKNISESLMKIDMTTYRLPLENLVKKIFTINVDESDIW